MERFEQLPGSSVEVDEGVKSTGLGDATGNTEVDPRIVDPDNTLDVNLAQLGNPGERKK